MSCNSCSSTNLRRVRAEIALHLKDIDRPHVFVFPEILVCLKCGFTELVMEENTLKVLVADNGGADPESNCCELSQA